MSWCPKCKLEYVEGKTICADCGSELVDEVPQSQELITFLSTEKELVAKKFVEFLHYSKMSGAVYRYDEEASQWIVEIEEKYKKQISKLYNAFYAVEAELVLSGMKGNSTGVESLEASLDTEKETLGEEENHVGTNNHSWSSEQVPTTTLEEDESITTTSDNEFESIFDQGELQDILENKKTKPKQTTIYVKKEDQYKDLKSSAATFLLVSVLGIVVLILNALDIISVFNGAIPNLVMGSLFIAFLYIGITSYQKAKKVEKEIDGEITLTKDIIDWISQNITAKQLDDFTNPEDTVEIRFLHKLDKMKEMITNQFGELDDSYLEQLTEDYYNSHFD